MNQKTKFLISLKHVEEKGNNQNGNPEWRWCLYGCLWTWFWTIIWDLNSRKDCFFWLNPNWDKGYNIDSSGEMSKYYLNQKWAYVRNGHWKSWPPWADLCSRIRIIQWLPSGPSLLWYMGCVSLNMLFYTFTDTPAFCAYPDSLSRQTIHKTAMGSGGRQIVTQPNHIAALAPPSAVKQIQYLRYELYKFLMD